MKILKCVLLTLLSLLLVTSPFLGAVAAALLTPPAYSDTFVGALNEKCDRLKEIEGEKIVVVGGSSVAFGVDSALLSRYTGMPVVNFGLYAALGTKLMLDLSLPHIGEGDIVVISPELDPQTLSLYFNADTTLKALDDDFSLISSLDGSDLPLLLGALWGFAQDKLGKGKEGSSDESVYLSRYFDEYGDFDYPREVNAMPLYYDVSNPINLTPDALGEDFFAFADYLNGYISEAERRGASVYLSLPPMNELSLSSASRDEDTSAAYIEKLSEHIDCEIIDDLDTAIMEAGYFFDTNFHLNDSGRTARTINLAKSLRFFHGITEGLVDAEPPEPPALPGVNFEFEGVDENAKYFTYRRDEVGGYYIITGLSEAGRVEKTLTLPLGYEGYKVLLVDKGAFKDGSLEKLIVTSDCNVQNFATGAFEGASQLSELWIYKMLGGEITPPESFDGVKEGFTVHVPEGSDFKNHYFWSERGLTFVEDAD